MAKKVRRTKTFDKSWSARDPLAYEFEKEINDWFDQNPDIEIVATVFVVTETINPEAPFLHTLRYTKSYDYEAREGSETGS